MKDLIVVCSLIFFLSSCAIAGPPTSPLDVVAQVDLGRYSGAWYEIASFPQWFLRGCENTRAVYTLQPDGTVEALNSCFGATGSTRYKAGHGSWMRRRMRN